MENNKTTTKVSEKQPVKKPRATKSESTNSYRDSLCEYALKRIESNNGKEKNNESSDFFNSVIASIGLVICVAMFFDIVVDYRVELFSYKISDLENRVSKLEEISSGKVVDKSTSAFKSKSNIEDNIESIEYKIAQFEEMNKASREAAKVEVKNVDILIKSMDLNVSVPVSEAKRIIDEQSSSQVIKILIGEDKEINTSNSESN